MAVPASRPSLTLAQQFLHLRANTTYNGAGALRAGGLVWRYFDSPTALSRSYAVRITYGEGDGVEVFVDDPDLSLLADGRDLPHVYSQHPARLCVYLPRAREWTPDQRIDLTIMPWTTLWLFYFEEWLLTGEWSGGGEHPDPDADVTDQERRQLVRLRRRRERRVRADTGPWPSAR